MQHTVTQESYSNSATEARGFSDAHLCKELLLRDTGEGYWMSLRVGGQGAAGKDRKPIRDACFDSPGGALGRGAWLGEQSWRIEAQGGNQEARGWSGGRP